jgi:hypothetical protein
LKQRKGIHPYVEDVFSLNIDSLFIFVVNRNITDFVTVFDEIIEN